MIPDLSGGRRMLWLNRNGCYWVGLHRLFPEAAIVCLDWGREYPAFAESAFSLERHTGERTVWTESEHHQLVPYFRERLRALLASAGPQWILAAPVPLPAFEELRPEGAVVASPSWTAAEPLRKKSVFLNAVEQLELPRFPRRWVDLRRVSYAEAARDLGPEIFLQKDIAVGGTGTYFAANAADWAVAEERTGSEPVLLSRDIGEVSLNIHALALPGGSVVGPASVQITGLDFAGGRRGSYCGNDYCSAQRVAPAVLDEIRSQTARVGGWLVSRGYLGLFGLDFVLHRETGRPYAIDLNARWQGSTALATQAELAAGRLPLSAAGLAWQSSALAPEEIRRKADLFSSALDAAQLLLRWRGPDSVPGDRLVPGVYSTERPFCLLGPGYSLEDVHGPGECLLTGGVPETGTHIREGATFARLYFRQPVLDPPAMTPAPWLRPLVEAVYEAATGATASRTPRP